ncbi:hypothetical protein [Salinisphaera sp. LB1]|nr:hypothetical protein [Salinisphaera sp. LB1]AWN15182.1 hypothetical protein SALB1_0975 [Salinisphaera sp. LB1]
MADWYFDLTDERRRYAFRASFGEENGPQINADVRRFGFAFAA